MDIVITALVTLFLLFYFIRDKYRVLSVLDQLVPLSQSENEQVRTDIRDTLGVWAAETRVVTRNVMRG